MKETGSKVTGDSSILENAVDRVIDSRRRRVGGGEIRDLALLLNECWDRSDSCVFCDWDV